jgi:hypothetical protein
MKSIIEKIEAWFKQWASRVGHVLETIRNKLFDYEIIRSYFDMEIVDGVKRYTQKHVKRWRLKALRKFRRRRHHHK